MTRPPSDLETAYRRARYRVADAAGTIELRIDAASSAAADLLGRHGVSSAALLTGCNPGSHSASATDNERAQRALETAVAAHGLLWLPGAGLDPFLPRGQGGEPWPDRLTFLGREFVRDEEGARPAAPLRRASCRKVGQSSGLGFGFGARTSSP